MHCGWPEIWLIWQSNPETTKGARMDDAVPNQGSDNFTESRSDVWLLFGSDLDQERVTRELSTGFKHAFADRCAVMHTDDLMLGITGGRLTLRRLDGRPIQAPHVAYARLPTPTMSTDREITLLRQLQAMGTQLLNPIDAVLACVNKFWHLQELVTAGLPVPDTLSYTDAPLSAAIDANSFEPCVVKSVRGHRGNNVFLAPTTAALRDVHGVLRKEVPYLLQEHCTHSHGRDLRVVVVDRPRRMG